jgi:flagellar hook-associated protein 2
MAAESAPLDNYDKKSAAVQAQVAAYGKLSGAIGSFQGSLSSLTSSATFRALSTTSGDEDVLTGSASDKAVPGTYKINVSQLAQAQSLDTGGRTSMTSMLGTTPTKLTFQFGTVSGGTFGVAGAALDPGVAAGGIAAGALTINGTAIATGATTRSAKDLAAAINAQGGATGVTATAVATSTPATLFGGGAPTFGDVVTDGSSTYSLSIGGVVLANAGTGSNGAVNAASIDLTLGGTNATTEALAAAGITFTGTAAAGDLQFTAADGSNIAVVETVSGAGVKGGLNTSSLAPNNGSSAVSSSTVKLTSASGTAIAVGGANPALAGLTAGTGGSYLGAGFDLDGAQAIGSVTLNAGDLSLGGIRDAINKANIGVTASIVSDGSSNPYHLVLTSSKTGASSTMKISVDGVDGGTADPAIASLLGYDPAGAQQLQQTSAAQSALLTVNGIQVQSQTDDVSGAIQGVTINAASTGTTTLKVTRDTKSITDAINGFVKAYNTLNTTMAQLTAYNPDSKSAGPLQGDATVRGIQSQLRAQLGKAVQGLGGGLTTLAQVGISFQKDGSLQVDSTKLSTAMTNNFNDIAGLFAAVGQASDGMISVAGSSAATKAGEYAVHIDRMASQGGLTSEHRLAAKTVIDPNTTWTVTLNQTDPTTASKVQNIAIPAGNYAPKELAAMLRSAINANSTFAGSGDTVETSIDPVTGQLSLTSSKYGSTSNIALAKVTGSEVSLVFGAAVPKPGEDVKGTIGGVEATGSGQTLSAAAGSPAEGLKLLVTGGTSGDRGTVSFSQGQAFTLNNLATSFIGTKGMVSAKTNGLNDTIKSIQKDRDAFSTRLTAIEARYRAQFTQLDTMLQSMQSTQTYLTQQLAALTANTSS